MHTWQPTQHFRAGESFTPQVSSDSSHVGLIIPNISTQPTMTHTCNRLHHGTHPGGAMPGMEMVTLTAVLNQRPPSSN